MDLVIEFCVVVSGKISFFLFFFIDLHSTGFFFLHGKDTPTCMALPLKHFSFLSSH